MTPHCRGNRLLVSGNARDDCGAGDGSVIELGNPSVRETVRGARVVPAESVQYCLRAARFRKSGMAGRQEVEKSPGKEVTMSIANPHGEEPIIIGLVSDTHGLIRNSLFGVLAGVSQILHAGDVGGREVLDALRAIAPVRAVCGNVDPMDGVLADEIAVEAGGLSIHLSHGHEVGSPTPAK